MSAKEMFEALGYTLDSIVYCGDIFIMKLYVKEEVIGNTKFYHNVEFGEPEKGYRVTCWTDDCSDEEIQYHIQGLYAKQYISK